MKERPLYDKILEFFLLDTLKTWFSMRNLTSGWKQSGHYFRKIGALFLIFKKGQERLVAGLYWSHDNTKKFKARLVFVSTAKMDNDHNSSKITSFFFFYASNCLFRVFIYLTPTLCEVCPNTEFFLVRIFPHSDWIRSRKNSVFGHFSRSVISFIPLPYCSNLFSISSSKVFAF